MEAPPTPKIRNSCNKRRMQFDDGHLLATPPSFPDWLDCQSLQRSLKRMKVTTSYPGEIRLQRDIRHATESEGWQVEQGVKTWRAPALVQQHSHVALQPFMIVRQSAEEPLQINVLWDNWSIWLDMPKLFPHRPPRIRSVMDNTHSRVCPRLIFQEFPDQHHGDHAESLPSRVRNVEDEVNLSGWNPILRLHEILHLVLAAVHRHFRVTARNEPIAQSSLHNSFPKPKHSSLLLRTSTRPSSLLLIQKDQCLQQHNNALIDEKLEIFPPNRFDCGYERYQSSVRVSTTSSMMMQE